MKRLFYLVLFVPVAVLAGVGNKSKEDAKREFVKSCVDSGLPQMTTEASKVIFRDYCACAGDKVIESFTAAELEDINRLEEKNHMDPYEQKLLTDRFMKVIKPCLDELQARVMAAQ